MPRNFHGLNFWCREIAPFTAGLYTIGRNNEVLYVGEAKNRFSRIRDYHSGKHDGLKRALSFGAEWIHYSDVVGNQQDRWDIETLMRRELNPIANLEPYPSTLSCTAAARRLGLSSLARKYDSLAKPAPRPANALSLPPGGPPARLNALALPKLAQNPFL